jgi:hypothetical protein
MGVRIQEHAPGSLYTSDQHEPIKRLEPLAQSLGIFNRPDGKAQVAALRRKAEKFRCDSTRSQACMVLP